jgi:hypothetical protein
VLLAVCPCLSQRYFLLGLIVVIVLLQVLVAIAVESYTTVKNTHSDELFWLSRLALVTEMYVISDWLAKYCGCYNKDSSRLDKTWTYVTTGSEDQRSQDEQGNRPDGSHFLLNLAHELMFVVIPIWWLLGFVTAGLLWPPQVRKRFWGARYEEQGAKDEYDLVEKVKNLPQDQKILLEKFINAL